jgi:predicted RNA-binding Zn ribbon-like protein
MTEHLGLALVATLRKRLTDAPIERLADPAALRNWFAEHGLPVTSCTQADLAAARALRETIYAVVAAAATGRRPDWAAVDALDAAASRPRPRRTLHWRDADGFRLIAQRLTAADALTVIADDTVGLLSGPDGRRLHQCEADTCGTVFVAPPGGRARRWCSSATCGNRERVRAHLRLTCLERG